MKVYIGVKNRLLDKLFNSKEACSNRNKFIMSNLLFVLGRSFPMNSESITSDEIELFFENRNLGQYIIVETPLQKKYIFFSYERPAGTRNGYIVAKLPLALRAYEFDNTRKKKTFEVFLLEVKEEDYLNGQNGATYENVNICNFTEATTNTYQTFAYQLCRTNGFKIINYERLPWEFRECNKIKADHPFRNIQEIRDMRNSLQKKNSGNKSSYLVEEENEVIIYGKTFGNNGFETLLIASAVKHLTTKKVYFWQIADVHTMTGEDRNPQLMTTENREFLESIGIVVFEEIREYIDNQFDSFEPEERNARNQLEFIKNLLFKYGTDEKECYLCKCNIQSLVIASHIHRVCDINRENKSFDEKRQEAISGDNGLWLCANHDKLFENGLIYFSDEGQLQLSEDITDTQKAFVNSISSKTEEGVFFIDREHFNDQMRHYIYLHRKRTHPCC